MKIRRVKIRHEKRLSKMSTTKMFISSSKTNKMMMMMMCVCVCVYVCCDNGREERKNALCIVFSFSCFSLALFSPFLFCCTHAIGGYSHRKSAREEEEEEKTKISLSNKNTITTMLLLLTNRRDLTITVRGKKEGRRKENARARASERSSL